MVDINWAFIPYWIYKNAKEQKIDIDAKMMFLYHLHPYQLPDAKKAFGSVDGIHPLTEQGEILTLKYGL